ncbi:carboxypeptidase-like regulatory domain-containing protein [Roseinatronobacter sp.]
MKSANWAPPRPMIFGSMQYRLTLKAIVARPTLAVRLRAMHWRSNLAALAILVASCISPMAASSHGAVIEAETAQAMRLHAFFDTGEPMPHAQVIIYAPDDADSPWGQGVTDREGRFEFIPDAREGRWSVQVRHSGHGATAHVHMGGDVPVIVTTTDAQSWLQRMVMVALVAWGAFGTALFVLRRNGRPDASA